MTTIKKIANHTGLDQERVEEILSSLDLAPEELTIDTSRIAIIKALRAGASGNVQKEELETEAARLAQAKRIKIEAQTKGLREELKPRAAFEGYLTDDSGTAKCKEAEARLLELKAELKNILAYQPEPEPEEEEPIPAPRKKAAPEPKSETNEGAPSQDSTAKTLNPAIAARSVILF